MKHSILKRFLVGLWFSTSFLAFWFSTTILLKTFGSMNTHNIIFANAIADSLTYVTSANPVMVIALVVALSSFIFFFTKHAEHKFRLMTFPIVLALIITIIGGIILGIHTFRKQEGFGGVVAPLAIPAASLMFFILVAPIHAVFTQIFFTKKKLFIVISSILAIATTIILVMLILAHSHDSKLVNDALNSEQAGYEESLALCQQVVSKQKRNNCFTGMLNTFPDQFNCSIHPLGDTRDTCFLSQARILDDVSYCFGAFSSISCVVDFAQEQEDKLAMCTIFTKESQYVGCISKMISTGVSKEECERHKDSLGTWYEPCMSDTASTMDYPIIPNTN